LLVTRHFKTLPVKGLAPPSVTDCKDLL